MNQILLIIKVIFWFLGFAIASAFLFWSIPIMQNHIENVRTPNLLKNGKFKEELNGWEVSGEIDYSYPKFPTDVQREKNPKGRISTNSLVRISDEGRKGKCVRFTNDENGKHIILRQYVSNLKPETFYDFSMYVRAERKIEDRNELWVGIGYKSNISSQGGKEGEDYVYIDVISRTYSDKWVRWDGKLKTGDYKQAFFWIMSDRQCDILIDDVVLVPK